MPTTEDVATWRGQDLRSSDDEKLGTIEEIYLDTDTREPEWALITTGMFGTKQSFVPLRQASRSGDGVAVPFDKATVKDAPKIDPDGQLSQPEEAGLYRHYGLQYGEHQSGSGLADRGATADAAGGVTDRSHGEDPAGAVGGDVLGPTTDDEPITDANIDDATSGAQISSEEHEVVLHEEEPVAEKRVVPKERVRLDKDVHVDERQVSETVRQEQLDVEDDGARSDRA